MHKYKLIPDVQDRYGAIVLNKRIQSNNALEVDVEFNFMSDEQFSHGFGIYFLENEPKFPDDFDDILGYRPDFQGLGVFLYRSEASDKWKIIALQNKGLDEFTDDRDLDTMITKKNSCSIDINKKMRGGIRIKILMDYIYI